MTHNSNLGNLYLTFVVYLYALLKKLKTFFATAFLELPATYNYSGFQTIG